MKWLTGIVARLFQRIGRGLSQYKEPQPFVILRHADYTPVEGRAKLEDDGRRQLNDAVIKLCAHYGDTATFAVYAVGSDLNGHLLVSARYVAEALKVGLIERLDLHPRSVFGEFGAANVVPVLITSEPMVQSIVLEAYRDYPEEAMSVDADPRFGVPYFLMLERAKLPDMTLTPYRLMPDKR